MPILITEQIVNATMQPEAGWSPVALVNYIEKDNKDKTAKDMVFFFECLGGPGQGTDNRGRRLSHTFYANALGASGGNAIKEVADLYLNFTSALTGLTRKELVGKEPDFKAMVGQQMYVEIQLKPYEGKLYANIVAAQPITVTPF